MEWREVKHFLELRNNLERAARRYFVSFFTTFGARRPALRPHRGTQQPSCARGFSWFLSRHTKHLLPDDRLDGHRAYGAVAYDEANSAPSRRRQSAFSERPEYASQNAHVSDVDTHRDWMGHTSFRRPRLREPR